MKFKVIVTYSDIYTVTVEAVDPETAVEKVKKIVKEDGVTCSDMIALLENHAEDQIDDAIVDVRYDDGDLDIGEPEADE